MENMIDKNETEVRSGEKMNNTDGKKKSVSGKRIAATALVVAGIAAGAIGIASIYANGYQGGRVPQDSATMGGRIQAAQAGYSMNYPEVPLQDRLYERTTDQVNLWNQNRETLQQYVPLTDPVQQSAVQSGLYGVAALPMESISAEELTALEMALNDEYKALATYQSVIDQFGDVRPFTNIMKAEQQHIDALVEIYDKYGLAVPENTWYGNVPEFGSLSEAFDAGVTAEKENAALYDNLLASTDNQDITAVFTSLRDASQYNHLPAFERGSARY